MLPCWGVESVAEHHFQWDRLVFHLIDNPTHIEIDILEELPALLSAEIIVKSNTFWGKNVEVSR